jgi:cytochrome c oxidase subunit II
VGKFWAILFGVTMAACFGLFVAAPFMGWWMPEGISTHYQEIDFLFYVILAITGFFFVLTEAILVGFLFRYGSQPDGSPAKPPPSRMASLLKPITGVLNEPHKIELAWTIVPAGILLYIAFAQVGTWAQVKYQSRYPEFVQGKIPVVTEVSARQFEWRVRYPSLARMKDFLQKKDDVKVKADFDSFARRPQFDDVHTVNELHTFVGHPNLIHLGTRDVIHSLNLPHLRIKQDALPGKMIPVWFIVEKDKSNTTKDDKTGRWVDGFNPETKQHDNHHIWDIACAELCGWGHYRMVGRLYVHKDQEDFLNWLEYAENEEKARTH